MSLPMSEQTRGQDKSRRARRGWEGRFTRIFRRLRQGVFLARTLHRNRRPGKAAGIYAFSAVR